MKNTFLIPIIAIIVSCNGTKDAAAQDEQKKNKLYEILTESQYQGREEKAVLVIKDQGALENLYASVNDQTVPVVDFSKEQIVAIFIGTRSNGGYGIKINEVVETDKNIKVLFETTEPQPGQPVTMALTNPFVILKIHSAKPIVFQ